MIKIILKMGGNLTIGRENREAKISTIFMITRKPKKQREVRINTGNTPDGDVTQKQ